MDKISVIIPAFNSAPTIEKCVRSVLSQSYPFFEVILVDDGSTDNTLALCRKFAESDKRVTVFHQDNKGVSAARNLGLEKACGEWITFVDSDDSVNLDYLSRMHACVSATPDVALYVGSVNVFRMGKSAEFLRMSNGIVSSSDLDSLFGERELHKHGFPFAKLYKLSLLKKNHIKFDVKQNMAEDCVLMINYILSCSSDASYVYFDEVANYDYFVQPKSLSTTCGTFDQELYNYRNIRKLFSQLIDMVHPLSAKKKLHSSIGWYADRCVNAIYKNPHGGKKERIKCLKTLGSSDILFRHDDSFKQKVMKLVLISGLYGIYDFIRLGKVG